jgi:hypothetical protein
VKLLRVAEQQVVRKHRRRRMWAAKRYSLYTCTALYMYSQYTYLSTITKKEYLLSHSHVPILLLHPLLITRTKFRAAPGTPVVRGAWTSDLIRRPLIDYIPAPARHHIPTACQPSLRLPFRWIHTNNTITTNQHCWDASNPFDPPRKHLSLNPATLLSTMGHH